MPTHGSPDTPPEDPDDFVEIEIVPGSGRYVRVPRRRTPLARLRTHLTRRPRRNR